MKANPRSVLRILRDSRRARGASKAAWCLAAALLLGSSLAAARPVPEALPILPPEPAPTEHVVQRGPISLEQATAMAASRFQGRVVRAETKMRGGRREHEIRILGEDGRVRTVRIDAQSGQFL